MHHVPTASSSVKIRPNLPSLVIAIHREKTVPSAVLMNDRKVRLGSMPVDQAKYIEDLLEERLGIHDMQVPGDVGENEV